MPVTSGGAANSRESEQGELGCLQNQFHIIYLELKAAFFALQCFQTQIGGKTVGLPIDNTTAVAAINSRVTGRACS